jgi:deoxyribodipyrimidine photo-lyase
MTPSPTIVWFRNDLRLRDHPPLREALSRGPVIPVYIWSPEDEGRWAPGAASRWWLHQSLESLGAALTRKGSRLILRRGAIVKELRALVRKTGARAVYFSQRYEPDARVLEKRLLKELGRVGVEARAFTGGLLYEPDAIRNRSGRPFQVFTQYWRTCISQREPDEPLPAPRKINAPKRWPASCALGDLRLEPEIDWAGGLRKAWRPGEGGAAKRLKRFVDEALADYNAAREVPATAGTSRLSPHLHFGEISPREVWNAVGRAGMESVSATHRGEEAYLRELGWREFAHHLLWHFPKTPGKPLRKQFSKFPWRSDAKGLRAWQRGRTGYPLVDAGMRELWRTGWMHNRVRMVVASFLVKDLLLPWQEGARWFWDTLVDADLANNTLGWQWSAGCGADAAPYFRIFNPVLQGKKFDPQGTYVRQWVPELARLPDRWIHRPWEAPSDVLAESRVKPDRTYPRPIVDHSEARDRALDAFAVTKR